MSFALLRYLRTQGVPGFAPVPLDSIDECLMIRILEVVDAKFIMRNLTRVNKRMNTLCSDDMLWNQKMQTLPWTVEGDVSTAWRERLGSSKAVFRMLVQVGWLDGFWMLDEKPRGALMRITIKRDCIESTLMAPQLTCEDPVKLQTISEFSIHEPFKFSVHAGGEVGISAENNDEVSAREFFRFTGSTPEDARAKVQFYTKSTARPLFFKLVQRGDRKYSSLAHERSPLHTGVANCPSPTGRQGMSGAPGHHRGSNMQYGAHYGQCAARGALGQSVPQVAAANRRPQPSAQVYTDPALEQARRLQGLWRGDFGPHGTELLSITMCNLISSRFTELVGFKCSGDPNVPCGEVAFRVPLACEGGPVEAGRGRGYTCSCAFQCDCPKPVPGNGAVCARHVYEGLALVAEHGFQSPTWNAAALVELEDGSGDILVVWKGLFSVRFSRLSDDLAQELPGRSGRRSERCNLKAAGPGEGAIEEEAGGDEMDLE